MLLLCQKDVKVQWSHNGHYYQLVPTFVTWTEAYDSALTTTFQNNQGNWIGYLVTITSQVRQCVFFCGLFMILLLSSILLCPCCTC